MKNKKHILSVTILILLVLLVAGCSGLFPKPTKGVISGRVLMPPTGRELSRDISGWVPAAGAEVTIVDANGVKHTVITDENGYYNFENIAVKANTVVTATVKVDGKTVVLKGVIPQGVAEDEDYNAGTMTPESTALALVVEKLITEGKEQTDIALEEIQGTESFAALVKQVEIVIEEQGNVTEVPDVTEGVEDTAEEIITSPAPPAPTPPEGPTIFEVTSARIEGAPVIGGMLTAKPKPTVATANYQWQRADSEDGNYVVIAEQTTNTYTPIDFDNGKFIRVEIKGIGKYSGTVTSEAIGPVSHVFNSTIKKGYETIQDAINGASEGNTILVGPGTYGDRDGAPPVIVYKDNLTIRAVDPNPANTIIETKLNGMCSIEFVKASTNNQVNYSSGPNAISIVATYVTIDGFTIRAPGMMYNSAGVMIGDLFPGQNNYLGDVHHNTIKNCEFKDLWHAVYIYRSSYNVIEKNYVHPLDTTDHWAAITIHDGMGHVTGETSQYNEILNNVLDNKGISVGAWANDGGAADLASTDITGTIIEGNTCGEDLSVNNHVFNGEIQLTYAGGYNVRIVNNEARRIINTGWLIADAPNGVTRLTNLVVTDNTIFPGGDNRGIHLSYFNRGEVSGNTVKERKNAENNPGVGIQIGYASDVNVEGNTTEDNDSAGILLLSVCNSTVKDNTIKGNNKQNSSFPGGLTIRAVDVATHPYSADGLEVTENRISGNKTGIWLGTTKVGTGNKANNNSITDNSEWGIQNESSIVLDATKNWWGSANGPGEDGANGVSGNVTYDPWCTNEGCTTHSDD